jgi:hypothetical protein
MRSRTAGKRCEELAGSRHDALGSDGSRKQARFNKLLALEGCCSLKERNRP